MINAQRQRVEQEMTTLVDNLDRTQLRKMQVKLGKSQKTAKHIFMFCVAGSNAQLRCQVLRG